MEIVRDGDDQWRFLKLLYYMNDVFLDPNWIFSIQGQGLFYRPDDWPQRKPLVEIAAYTLMPNHFHLILREMREGGVSCFMKKLGQSMSNHANEKYAEKGSLFQGSYRSKTISSDSYFRYVAAYVMAKNTFELYPRGGLLNAQQNFDEAWKWGVTYPFSSLGDYVGERPQKDLLKKGLLGKLFTPESFKSNARDVIQGGKWKDDLDNLE